MAKGILIERFVPIVVILFTSLISAILIVTRHDKTSGMLLSFVQNDRSSVALIVQVVSSILGFLQICVAVSLFNFATRIWVWQRPTTIGRLNFWLALSATKVDFNLPFKELLLTALIFAASNVPGALWAGALTPLLTTVTRDGAVLQIPAYTSDTQNGLGGWDNEFQLQGVDVWNILGNCTSIDNEIGFISSCPVPDLQASLLSSGSSASTLSGLPRNHSKIDNPSWSYTGRSYGVASSQGIVSPAGFADDLSPLSYTYTQAGYNTDVTCTKNSSADFAVQWISSDEFYVTTWEITGYLPNSVPGNHEDYPTVTWYSTNPETTENNPPVLGWSAVVNADAKDRNMIAIAAGGAYQALNQTQCTVVFTSQQFNVSVNVTEQTISVTPLNNINATDPEPTGRLVDNAMWSLNLLSRMTDSLYVSTLGNTLQKNVKNTLNRPGLNMTTEEATLSAISDSFTAMLDDILVAYGSSQIGLQNVTTSTEVTGILPAVQVGTNYYIFATMCINVFLLFALLIEVIRTNFWMKLPPFDYRSSKSMIVAASAGRGSIAREVGSRHNTSGTQYTGNSSDKLVDMVRFQLLPKSPVGGVNIAMNVVYHQNVVSNGKSYLELEQGRLMDGSKSVGSSTHFLGLY